MTPTDTPMSLCMWKKERTQEFQNNGHHGLSVVVPTVRGGLVFPKTSCFLATVWLSSSFNSIISYGCSTSRWFHYKKAICNLISTSFPFPLYSIPSSLDLDLIRESWEVKWRFTGIPSWVCTMVQVRSQLSISFSLFFSPFLFSL